MKRKSFTLIELITVIIVLGILVSISAPKVYTIIEKSKQAEAITILTKMYNGYKAAIVDDILIPEGTNYKLYNFGDFEPGSERNRCFNPDEIDAFPDSPVGRSAASWAALGFEKNPNNETTDLHFSYDFLKPASGWPNAEDYLSTGPGNRGTGIRPSTAGFPQSIGVAWRKENNTPGWLGFYDIHLESDGLWIFIDMKTGEITKGDFYQ